MIRAATAPIRPLCSFFPQRRSACSPCFRGAASCLSRLTLTNTLLPKEETDL